MAETFDLILQGGTVVNHGWARRARHRRRAAGGSRRSAISRAASAAEVVDAKGLHVLPGVIDTQVHFREPGLEHKEDLETGSRAAVLGGVTAVFEMPNTKPLTTIGRDAGRQGRPRARDRMLCDFAFYVGGTRENIADIPALERLPGCGRHQGVHGLVDRRPAGRGRAVAVARSSPASRRRAAFHAEDEARLKRAHAVCASRAIRHRIRSGATREAALIATQRLVRLAEKHGRRVHVLHVSTAEEMAFLADHKDVGDRRGDAASSDAGGARMLRAARHLCADEPAGPRRAPSPSASGRRSREGVVDVLGSDHAPHTREEKDHALSRQPFRHDRRADAGADHARSRQCRPADAGALRRSDEPRPQRLFGIRGKGRIAVGYDADFTIVDLKRRETITNAWIASRCGWTPYDGSPSRAGRSAPSCAASASCGTAPSSGRRMAGPCALRERATDQR